MPSFTTSWSTCPINASDVEEATVDAISSIACTNFFKGDKGLYSLKSHADINNHCTRNEAYIAPAATPECYELISDDWDTEPIIDGVIQKGAVINKSANCPMNKTIPVFSDVVAGEKSCFNSSLQTVENALNLTVNRCGELMSLPTCKKPSQQVIRMPQKFDVETYADKNHIAIPPGDYDGYQIEDKYWNLYRCTKDYMPALWENPVTGARWNAGNMKGKCGWTDDPTGTKPVQRGMIYSIGFEERGDLTIDTNDIWKRKCVRVKGDCDEGDCMKNLLDTYPALSESRKSTMDKFVEVIDCPSEQRAS